MSIYRRNRVPGGTYFFTVNLRDRTSDLLVTQIEAPRASVRQVKKAHPFHIDAWVVLPDHMHCLWTLPSGDTDFPARWGQIKIAFSRVVRSDPAFGSLLRKHESGIWQRHYWEHTIRGERDYANHMDYVHFNPVKHQLVVNVADWPFSSFARSVGLGVYPADWHAAAPDLVTSEMAGER